METIRNYLESMFSSLPNTTEVLQAKFELSQMMEDKYTELINEGKADNEAVGIVISEFGNLDEIAEALGIQGVLQDSERSAFRNVFIDEVRDYIAAVSRAGFLRGLAVLLCICSPVGCIMAAGIDTPLTFAVGTAFLFIMIAAAVGLFIYTSIHMSHWEFIRKRQCRIDYATAAYVNEQRDGYRSTQAIFTAVGVILCIISVVPVSVMGALDFSSDKTMSFSSALIFVLVGIGVLLIIASSHRNSAYANLLNLNTPGTIGGTYRTRGSDDEIYYDNKTVSTIMSVFWPTVTCIYLIWSFLTFNWGFTWIIWPIAAIVEMVIKRTLGTTAL